MATTRVWRLVARPTGIPDPTCFELGDMELPALKDGEILVENDWMSVEPSMRGRIGADLGYDPIPLGGVLNSRAIGRVLESRSPTYQPGDLALHSLGWRERSVVPAAESRKVEAGVPPQAYMGVLGGPGLTGYFGLLYVCGVREGDVVFVSGAAGAVGSLVVQLAKLKGAARVIGSASGAEKAAWLKEIGCDEVIDYKAVPDLHAALAQAAPDGIDVYFDNVGGDHLFAAIANAKPHARFAECGMIGDYNTGYQGKPRNLMQIIVKRIRIEGFGGADFFHRLDEFYEVMTPLVASGQIHTRETVMEGLEQAPAAFIGLFTGKNIGKMVVKLR